MRRELLFGLVFAFCVINVNCAVSEVTTQNSDDEFKDLGRQLVEQGRTLVHNTVKRFMVILPAIFFKLGIAFTLLILIALAAVNNGFIGFLLLVVGMSSVLARLQGSGGAPVPIQYISPLPPYHHHGWDRSDSVSSNRNDDVKTSFYNGYVGQSQQYSPTLSNYYAKYAATKV